MKRLTTQDMIGLIGLGGAGVACVSVSYEYGFAHALGLDLLDLSLGVEDLARSALGWAPMLFAGLVGCVLLELFSSHVEGGRTEEQLIAATTNPNRTRKIRNSPSYLFVTLGAVCLIIAVWCPESMKAQRPQMYALSWLTVVGFFKERPSIMRKFGGLTPYLIWAIGGIVFLVHSFGANDALRAMSPKNLGKIELTTGQTLDGQIVRRYVEYTVFVGNGQQDATLIPTSDIRSVKISRHGALK